MEEGGEERLEGCKRGKETWGGEVERREGRKVDLCLKGRRVKVG